MSISENLAKALQRYKRKSGLTFMELSEELGFPTSSLENFYTGNSNPRADSLELISEKTKIPLTEIVSGLPPGQEQAETILRSVKELASLPPERRERGLQLFLELMELFAEEDLN